MPVGKKPTKVRPPAERKSSAEGRTRGGEKARGGRTRPERDRVPTDHPLKVSKQLWDWPKVMDHLDTLWMSKGGHVAIREMLQRWVAIPDPETGEVSYERVQRTITDAKGVEWPLPKPESLYQAMRKYQDVKDRYQKLVAYRLEDMTETVLEVVESPRLTPADKKVRVDTYFKILRHLDPARWGDKTTVEHAGMVKVQEIREALQGDEGGSTFGDIVK